MAEVIETGGQDSGSATNTAAVEESNGTATTEEIPDSMMPLSFVSERHLQPIEGISCITQTWRMKERVRQSGSCVIFV